MKTKLTLTVDKKVIERARKRSRSEGKSISQMFEDAFDIPGSGQPSVKNAKQTAAAHFIRFMHGEQAVKALPEVAEEKARASYLKQKHG